MISKIPYSLAFLFLLSMQIGSPSFSVLAQSPPTSSYEAATSEPINDSLRADILRRLRFHGQFTKPEKKIYREALTDFLSRSPIFLLHLTSRFKTITIMAQYNDHDGIRYIRQKNMLHLFGNIIFNPADGIIIIYHQDLEKILTANPYYYLAPTLQESIGRLLVHNFASNMVSDYELQLEPFFNLRATKQISRLNGALLRPIQPKRKGDLSAVTPYEAFFQELQFPQRYPTDVVAAIDKTRYFAVSIEQYLYDKPGLASTLAQEELRWLDQLLTGKIITVKGEAPLRLKKSENIDYSKLKRKSRYDLTEDLVGRIRFFGPVPAAERKLHQIAIRQIISKMSHDFMLAIWDIGMYAIYAECPESTESKVVSQCNPLYIYPEAGTMVIVPKVLRIWEANQPDYSMAFQRGFFHELCHHLHARYPKAIDSFLALRGRALLESFRRDTGMIVATGDLTANVFKPESWATFKHYCAVHRFPMRNPADCHSAANEAEYWAVSAEMYFFDRKNLSTYLSKEELAWLDRFKRIIGRSSN
ncbi:MAG: hypothetical protein A2284_01745 [Deltaproteobacteria bacterium RIFOXYA12_FULL_61_11]|nr:MAG: hypothetical protein A2284_01745 [Deltaproteobacteria bacterium RIFOXYA12_FULL_61_11]